MKRMLIPTMVFASLALVMMMATAQSDPVVQQLQQIRTEVAQLGLRIDRLEQADGAAPSSGGSASARPTLTMVLVSISKATHTGGNSQEIARLQRKCDALMNAVNSTANQKESEYGEQRYASHVRGGVSGWGGTDEATTSGQRQFTSEQDIENRYASEHDACLQKLQALQAAATEPRQILVGHDGKTIITLETKVNLSDALDAIAIGDTVTWTGSRVSADTGSESWEIDSIKKVK